MKRSFVIITCLLALPVLTACAGKSLLTRPASPDYPTVERPVGGCAPGENAFDCDRRAILAMLGNYQVKFNFDETVVLKAGYERKAPKRSVALEHVLLVEDAGRRISLQHILVMGGGTVTKHWRQDWVYESPRHWVYVGNQRFEPREREAAAIPGTWTQLVYEVNDGPRYAGNGKWNHKYGISTWTSDRTWRPLPRREYTKRNDYQLINGENRHTITPQGWAHEQDNTKVVRTESGKDIPLVREFGFNEYRRIQSYDFEPASAYWLSTSSFWEAVRHRWDSEFAKYGSVTLNIHTGDEIFNTSMLELADAYAKDPRLGEYLPKLNDIFRKFVNVDSTPLPTSKIPGNH